MALRFEKAFGIDMDTLMRMRNSYDIAQTRSRAKKIKVELKNAIMKECFEDTATRLLGSTE